MSRRSWAFDIAVAAVVGVLGQLEAWTGMMSTHRQGPLWAQSLLYAVTSLLLVARRVRPRAVLVAMWVTCTLEFAVFGSPEGNAVALPVVIAIYTGARLLPTRQSLWSLAMGPLMWASWALLDPMNRNAPASTTLLTLVWLSPFVIAWLLGALVRVTHLYAEQRRVTREQRASRAVAEERNRIARELHDVIGHSVSVMTVQASAVRRRLTPDQVAERHALEAVEAVGREALTEMRRMVGVLRQEDESASLEPPPGLEQLDRLADKFRASGLPVEVSVSGSPQPLAPGLDLTAYRLVQEGLTNTLRHARGPQRAEVLIDYGPEQLQLAVRDDGQPAAAHDPAPEAGNGLLGMRERVAVYGGSLTARARPEGGFEMLATLPLGPA